MTPPRESSKASVPERVGFLAIPYGHMNLEEEGRIGILFMMTEKGYLQKGY